VAVSSAVTVSDGVEFEVSMEVPGVAGEEPEHVEQGKYRVGLNLQNNGGLGHGEQAKG
jgi:hypothetical protein